MATALLHDTNLAEDVVHDVFCKLIESREKIKPAGSLKSFLGTCVINLARDKLRARQSQPCDLDEAAATVSDTNGPEHHAIFGEEARILHQALGQLAYEQREVIMLHLRGGMKFREIAALQEISINTAKSRYRYGLDKLRTSLSDRQPVGELDLAASGLLLGEEK